MTERYAVTKHRYLCIVSKSVVFVECTNHVEILNETATIIFESMVRNPLSIQESVEYLSEQYSDNAPSKVIIEQDITNLFEHWKSIGLIETVID